MALLSIPYWLNRPHPDRALKPALLLLTLIPVLALTLYPANLSFAASRLPVHNREHFSHSPIGTAGNYLPPLIIAVAVFVAHAIKDHSAKLALSVPA